MQLKRIDDRLLYAASRIIRPTFSFYSYPYGNILFAGDGHDGDRTISASVTIVDSSIYQYKNLTINSGQTLTGYTGGFYPAGLFLLVSGRLTINGTISCNALATAGVGVGGDAGADAQGGWNCGTVAGRSATYVPYALSGAGGGGGFGGYTSHYNGAAGGGALTYGGDGGTTGHHAGYTDTTETSAGVSYGILGHIAENLSWCGACGGGGGCGNTYNGRNGGAGGGLIYIECNRLFFNAGGVLTANGGNGVAAVGDEGAGGAGGGGFIIIRAKMIETNAGTITVTGGTGGAAGTGVSGAGGNGRDGTAIIVEVG